MPQVQDLSIYDNQGTPVLHTFEPTRVTSDRVTWHDKSDSGGVGLGMIAGFPSIVVSNRLPTKDNSNYKCTVQIRLPEIQEGINSSGSPMSVIADGCFFKGEFVIPSYVHASDRDKFYGFIKNLLADTVSQQLINQMEIPY